MVPRQRSRPGAGLLHRGARLYGDVRRRRERLGRARPGQVRDRARGGRAAERGRERRRDGRRRGREGRARATGRERRQSRDRARAARRDAAPGRLRPGRQPDSARRGHLVIKRAGPQDVPFLKDMLRHAYYWRAATVPETGEPPVQRYVERWGRPGDTALIAIQDFQPVGAAWYRLFKEDNPGYGFVDEETPEPSIAGLPSQRRPGAGAELLDALMARARAEGYSAISLSVEKDNPAVSLYERHGFEPVREDDGAYTMRAELTGQ